jgi:hypothetical protein
MREEERQRLLGDDVIATIRARVQQAPEPPDETVEALRRVLAPAVRRLMEAGRRRQR